MDIFSLLTLWLHVIAAVVWVGGNLILAMVIVPHFKQNLPPVQRIQILTQIGKRFEPIVWGCIGVLFFTGIVNIFFALDLTSPTAISNAFMRTLLIKIVLFFVLVILTAVHSMIFATPARSGNRDLRPGAGRTPVGGKTPPFPDVNRIESHGSRIAVDPTRRRRPPDGDIICASKSSPMLATASPFLSTTITNLPVSSTSSSPNPIPNTPPFYTMKATLWQRNVSNSSPSRS